jgi:hypothetical protein
MQISELEDRIYELDNKIDALRFDLNQQVGFIAGSIAELSEEYITTAIVNNLLPHSIQNYIVNNYKNFSSRIVSTLLESEHFYVNSVFRSDYVSNKILEDYNYLDNILANPNLNPFNKKEIKKRIAKHKRDLKKNDGR